jgi:quinol monooxygenase YgiN
MAYVLIARMVAREGEQDRAAEILGRLTAASRAEPGNVHYIPHRAADDPRVFVIYEQYRDKAAFEEHGQAEHFKTIAQGELFPLMEGERQRDFYETLDQ